MTTSRPAYTTASTNASLATSTERQSETAYIYAEQVCTGPIPVIAWTILACNITQIIVCVSLNVKLYIFNVHCDENYVHSEP